MLLLAKSEDIADSLSLLTQGRKMLVFSYLLWKDNMRFHNILLPDRGLCVLCDNSYLCSIVTTAISRTETLFFSRWPWSGLSRPPKVKLIMPSNSRHIASYTCSIVTIALSRTESLFFQQMTLIWPFKVTKGQTDHAIRTWPPNLLLTSYKCCIVTIALSRTSKT